MIRAHVVALSLALGAGATQAQRTRVTLDATSARMQYADSLNATALSLSPTIRRATSRTSLNASGTLSQLGSGTTAFGSVDGSVFTTSNSRFATELELLAGGSTHSNGGRTGQFLASARAHVTSATRGLWLGAGAGRTWDGAWRNVVQGDAGAWLSAGAGVVSLALTPTAVDDSIRYGDALLSLAHRARSVDLIAAVGARAGDHMPSLPANRRLWGDVTIAAWVAPTAAIVASAGSYPVDFAQGFPGGRYVSLGLRLASRRVVSDDIGRYPARDVRSSDLRRFEMRHDTGEAIWLRVLAPSASSVEISADFSAWSPLSLNREGGGWWSLSLPISAGTHQIAVRVDGGQWRVPPGLTPLTDEFGVVTGLLDVR